MVFPAPVITITLALCAALTSPLKVIDMSYDLSAEAIVWPGAPKFNFTVLNRGHLKDDIWLEINYFGTPEHKSTHVDAPAHFHKNGWRAHQVPVSSLVGPAIVVDVSFTASNNKDFLLTLEDFQDWERKHGRVPEGAIVIMNSGWGALYPDPKRVYSTEDPTNASTFHFPGIHPDAALWLVENRDVRAVGVDTPSTDGGQTTSFGTHRVLARHGVLGLENLMSVGLLPPRGATVVIGMIKLQDGSGGPARIMALLNFGPKVGFSDCINGSDVFALVLTALVVLVLFFVFKVFR